MKATNFRLTSVTNSCRHDYMPRGKILHSNSLVVYADYDADDNVGGTRKLSACLEVEYFPGKRGPELSECKLDMTPGYSRRREGVYLKDNRPIKIEIHDLDVLPCMPLESSKSVDRDYLNRDPNYKSMIGLIPDTEPIKPILEALV